MRIEIWVDPEPEGHLFGTIDFDDAGRVTAYPAPPWPELAARPAPENTTAEMLGRVVDVIRHYPGRLRELLRRGRDQMGLWARVDTCSCARIDAGGPLQ
jgi:hypothetical protein